MYKIQKIFSDIDINEYDISKLKYEDDVFIFLNRGYDFDSLIKIKFEEIVEINDSGIVIKGFNFELDENENLIKEYYMGIFVYKIVDGFILTKDGYKVPIFVDDKLMLTSYENILGKKIIEWQFGINKFVITLNISGNIFFETIEAKNYINNIIFENCIVYGNRIELNMNDFMFIYMPDDIVIKYREKNISFEQFFEYISENIKSSNNAVYKINRIYELEPIGFIISEY